MNGLTATDYYAFGMVMPSRKYSSSNYRYGFNGKENDDEVKGAGNQQDYGMRIYDPRLGKFLSVDPLTKDYPWYTPYQFAGNKPIQAIDLDGLEEYYTTKGELIGKVGTSTQLMIVNDDYTKAKAYIIMATDPEFRKYEKYAKSRLNEVSTPAALNTDQAALQWSMKHNSESINEKVEYGSLFYEVNLGQNKAVMFTDPVKGKESSVRLGDEAPPDGKKAIGAIHSHSNYSPNFDNNNFSDNDKKFADYKLYNFYVSTPDGSLKKYYYKTENIEVISTDIPSDPKDPQRKNNIEKKN